MTSKLATARRGSKKPGFRIRNQNVRIRNQISPVMQAVKGLLPERKAAETLHFLLDEPLGNCQKLLSGARAENAAVLTRLLCLEEFGIGRAVLLAIGEQAETKVGYIEEVRRRHSLRAMKQQLDQASQFYKDAIAAELSQ